jgi:capsular polysaccharide transport system permease protein
VLVPRQSGSRPDEAAKARSAATRSVGTGFVFCVGLPTLAVAIYLLFVASNRFVSEAQFIVRNPANAASSQMASLVQGSSIVRSDTDSQAVQAYLQSRNIIDALVAKHGLLERITRSEADVLWRYPGPFFAPNAERLYRYMSWMVSVDYDSSTGITTLQVQAFRPDDARDIATAMLDEAEALINELNRRSLNDSVRLPELEVTEATRIAQSAENKMSEFRKRNALIDPNRVATATLDTISNLTLEKSQVEALAAETEKSAPLSNQLISLREHIDSLDAQILKERQQLAGTDQSLAPLISEYDRLSLERDFAAHNLSLDLSNREAALADAMRQQLYLERVSTPMSPDYPLYPTRLLDIVAVLAACWISYAIGRRLIAEFIAHSDI